MRAASGREEAREGAPFDLFVNADWDARHPGLVAGVTAAGGSGDFGLTTVESPAELLRRYAVLGRQLGFPCVALARQVHGAGIVEVGGCGEASVGDGGETDREDGGREIGPEGPRLLVPGEADGLWTRRPAVLLAATAADCVPAYLLVEGRSEGRPGPLALVHAGWRGVAAGVLEAAVHELTSLTPAEAADLRLHLGPAICGGCYEVGREVLRALGHESPAEKGRVDLRRELTERAVGLGIPADRITRSPWCTRCGADRFHSHRGSGHRAGRMAAFLGWRAGER